MMMGIFPHRPIRRKRDDIDPVPKSNQRYLEFPLTLPLSPFLPAGRHRGEGGGEGAHVNVRKKFSDSCM